MLLAQTKSPTPGSIGANWPPVFDPNSHRLKGLLPSCISSVADLRRATRAVDDADNSLSTRTTVRLFVDRSLREGIRRENPILGSIEAVVPVDHIFPGVDLVYFGRNSPCRVSSVIAQELSLIRQAQTRAPLSREAAFSRVQSEGYTLDVLGKLDSDTLSQLVSLYREAYAEYTFEINAESLTEMINSGTGRFIVARTREGDIASAMAAERAFLSVDSREVALFELSDYATFQRHRNHGLMTAMQMVAIDTIRSSSDGPSAIIFAEDRASWGAVLMSSASAGMEFCGILQNHCRLRADRTIAVPLVNDGAPISLEDLAVWHAPFIK